MGQIGPKWDKSPKCTEIWSENLSHLGPIWPISGTNLVSASPNTSFHKQGCQDCWSKLGPIKFQYILARRVEIHWDRSKKKKPQICPILGQSDQTSDQPWHSWPQVWLIVKPTISRSEQQKVHVSRRHIVVYHVQVKIHVYFHCGVQLLPMWLSVQRHDAQ